MNVKYYYLFWCGLLGCFSASAQTTYLPLNTPEYHLLDRLETKTGMLSSHFFELKPIARKDAVDFLRAQKQNVYLGRTNLSTIDEFNIRRALSISSEWVQTADGMDGAIPSRKPILKYFYRYQPDFLHVSTEDFFLVVNPVVYAEAISERGAGHLDYINTRGAEVRGRILNKIGFYTMLADNQEKVVGYVADWIAAHQAFPGMDYYRNSGRNQNYDLFMARAYVDAGFFNDHLQVTFGYDKNFYGDGLRSLFLSDFGAPATFLRLRAQVDRWSYQSLFLELTSDYKRGSDQQLKHKYATLHQIGYAARPWLHVGLFESTVFAEENHFKAAYLVPVIGYRSVARALGADHKTSLGIFFKAVAWRTLQLYGQGYFDQLKLAQIGASGWWGNQFGVQLGAKYFDAFTLRNLDIQGEVNMVRPFTYASSNSVTDYTHYNQPLAHPFGASFAEVIGKLYYQPIPKVEITAQGIFSLQGTDSTAAGNQGNNIFKPYGSRNQDEGFSLISGERTQHIYLNLNAAYEWKPNIFFEAGVGYLDRRLPESNVALPASTYFYGGLRWNIARKNYDFF